MLRSDPHSEQKTCTVILFPLASRIGKVRHTAQMLSSKSGEDATLYWKQVVAANRKHLQRVGMAPPAIESEIRRFFNAVKSEMDRPRLNGGANSNNPGAA